MPRPVHNCRWHRIREGTISFSVSAYLAAKVQNIQSASKLFIKKARSDFVISEIFPIFAPE
jgi:hypothetical protein